MKFMTNGLIIKEQNIGEKDKLVTILTDTHGVVKAFARGAKDIKSPKCAATGLLSYSKLTLHKGKDSYIVGDAKSLRIFSGLRTSIENMYCAQYFCELAAYLCPKEQEADEQEETAANEDKAEEQQSDAENAVDEAYEKYDLSEFEEK